MVPSKKFHLCLLHSFLLSDFDLYYFRTICYIWPREFVASFFFLFKAERILLDVSSSDPVLQSPLFKFPSSHFSSPALIPSSDQKNWSVLVQNWTSLLPKGICLLALDTFLLEAERSSLGPESGQEEVWHQKILEQKFEATDKDEGQMR